MKAIVCDLDGTLCNDDVRKELIQDIVGVGKWGETEYNRYYAEMHTDTPFEHIREILHRFESDHKIIFVTGRPARFADKTKDWIFKHTSLDYEFILIMREDGDYRCDTEIKTEIFNERIKPEYDVLFVLEDRTRVVNMWRNLGIPCLQVQQSDY